VVMVEVVAPGAAAGVAAAGRVSLAGKGGHGALPQVFKQKLQGQAAGGRRPTASRPHLFS
jgi:hypothetical protein